MRVLVCGGREFADFERLCLEMDRIDRSCKPLGITHVISGAAQGADRLAAEWSKKYDLPVSFFPADRKKHGRAAGPIRNQKMLDAGKPDLVVAFHGGRGTADMVRRARAAGVEVIEVPA